MNTPFQWMKQVASHYGGTRNPLVISWPNQITEEYYGGIRTQWHHVIDIGKPRFGNIGLRFALRELLIDVVYCGVATAPTILEAIGIQAPAIVNGVTQRPYEGVPIGYSFFDPKAPSTRTTQYFEMLGEFFMHSYQP